MGVWNGESDGFITRKQDTWVSEDGRKPAERWERYIDIEYEVDSSVSKDYLQGAIDVLYACKGLLHHDFDKTAMGNLIQKLQKERDAIK